jgi:acetoin utilization deacetylase AcuC-like enzyme
VTATTTSFRLKAFHSPRYTADIGNHVMPIRKFDLVRAAIEAEGLPVEVVEPAPATDEDLLRVHTREYVNAIATGEPRALAESQKFPWSAELAQAVRLTNGGCIAGLYAALERGVAANLASGFHHSHADHGEGFCTFNGLVVAYDRARAEKKLARALVVDLDLHYGNGTASLLRSRPELFQVSVYGSWYKENKASSDVTTEREPDTDNAWSVAVPNGASGAAYNGLVEENVLRAIEKARPDAILYQAGADPYREDPYSPLDVGHEDLYARDRLVLSIAKEKKIPIVWVLAGGYTKDVAKVVAVHVGTVRATLSVFSGT